MAGVTAPGDYEKKTPVALGPGDKATATIEVLLKGGGDTLIKKEPATIITRSTSPSVRTPSLDP